MSAQNKKNAFNNLIVSGVWTGLLIPLASVVQLRKFPLLWPSFGAVAGSLVTCLIYDYKLYRREALAFDTLISEDKQRKEIR
jgi:hypothetical protein